MLAQEMWRKAQLSGTEGGLDRVDEGEGGRGGGGEGEMENWMEKAQETINSLKNGKSSLLLLCFGGGASFA